MTDIRRGDIVVFKYPEDPERDFIKRVIGLPGETIELRDHRIHVDGRAIDEPYAHYLPRPSGTGAGEIDVGRRAGALRPGGGAGRVGVRDGGQPGQFAGLKVLGVPAEKEHQGESPDDLLVVRQQPGRAEPVHPDPMGAAFATDSLTMGRLIRLLVTAAVAWAAWHAGMAAWKQFQFSDEVATIAKFGPDKDAGTVTAAVLEAAARYDLPVAEKDVRIRQQERPAELYIDVTYTVPDRDPAQVLLPVDLHGQCPRLVRPRRPGAAQVALTPGMALSGPPGVAGGMLLRIVAASTTFQAEDPDA